MGASRVLDVSSDELLSGRIALAGCAIFSLISFSLGWELYA